MPHGRAGRPRRLLRPVIDELGHPFGKVDHIRSEYDGVEPVVLVRALTDLPVPLDAGRLAVRLAAYDVANRRRVNIELLGDLEWRHADDGRVTDDVGDSLRRQGAAGQAD